MKRSLVFLLVSTLSAVPAWAKPHWHENQKHWDAHWTSAEDDDRDVNHHAARCYFQPHDLRIIREYYVPQGRSLPPGLAKKFARTARLPPGWERKMLPFPVVVERQLTVLPPEYSRGYIDGSVVVYSAKTHVMIDIVTLVRR